MLYQKHILQLGKVLLLAIVIIYSRESELEYCVHVVFTLNQKINFIFFSSLKIWKPVLINCKPW